MKGLLQLFFVGLALGAWQDGVEIKSKLRQDELRIVGKFSGHPEDHLNVLRWNSDNVFIGGRDKLYRLSLDNLEEKSTLDWTVSSHHRDQCQIKGQPDSECYNFVRVFHGPLPLPHRQLMKREERNLTSSSLPSNDTTAGGRHSKSIEKINDDGFIVCGTNAFKPTCRYYSPDLSNYTSEFSGLGYSPFSPTHESTSVLHEGAVYSGTVADFSGTDALIYKSPLRTEQYDPRALNSPAFVSSTGWDDFALFFFREYATEHMNCGKAIFSRVARLCRHDHGSRKHRDRFTTFLKARLNCSVPGEFPFYFDHIRGTTDIFMNNATGNEMLYAVFTTPPNSIGGSAVCGFTIKSIMKAFNGPFKGQAGYNANWLPVPAKEVPQSNLGRCSNDPAHALSANSLAFLKDHPLMDEAVEGQLIMVMTKESPLNRFTTIEVDRSPEVEPYHILYVGTETGKVMKAIVNASSSPNTVYSPEYSVISQSWDVFPGKLIKSLRLVSPKRLLVTCETDAVLIKVDHCEEFRSCSSCLKIRDPHCTWDIDNHKCISKEGKEAKSALSENLIQDVTAGDINLCPSDDADVTNPDVNAVEANHLKSINGRDASLSPGRDDSKDSASSSGAEPCCACTPSSESRSNPLDTNTFEEQQSSSSSSSFNGENYSENEIPRLRNSQQDYELSYVKSNEGGVSSRSVIAATVSSGALSLLVGFAMGFILARWMGARQNKTKDSSSNAQLSVNETQRLTTKPIDFVVNVPTANKNPLKNNLNSETLEKKVKKMYI